MKSNMVENNVETDKNKQEAEEKVFPTSDRLVFTTHDNVTITLNASDMAYIHQYYTEQLTADYLRENNPDWSEDKVQTIAIETRNQMKKYDYEESYAINEAIAWYEEYESAEEEILVSIYEQIESKSVLDMDGFSTDYTMYRNTYSGEYVFIFGDKDIYTPENSDFDWTCDTEEEAWDWFHSYHGFEESIEQEIKRTVEDTTVDNSKKEVDNDITASPELQTRIDEMAIRLTNLYKFYIYFLIIRINTILSSILKYKKTLILPRIYHD